MVLAFSTAAGAFLIVLVNLIVVMWVNRTVTEPYMDEVFHVKQYGSILNWIKGESRFVWDEAITTFPGLYFFSAFFAWIPQGESLYFLRGINAVVIPLLMYATVSKKLTKSIATAIAVLLLPTNFFYFFLYYTDAIATASVLIVFACTKRYTKQGLVGISAVLMRQTNIVWLFGLCMSEVLHRIQKQRGLSLKMSREILRDMYTSILAGIGFVVIYILNGNSIVLGHQEYHSMSLHFAQMNYFVLLAVAFAGPFEWFNILNSIKKTNFSHFLIFFFLSVAASEFGTVVHPFILADNRHYTFYLYRNFLSRRWIRSLAVPALVSLSLIHGRILKGKIPGMSKTFFWICTFLCLVPSPLFELRYFNVPLSLLFIGGSSSGENNLATSSVCFSVLVNACTLYMFLNRPFRSHDNSISRFMF